jgi:hypothetical protein
MMSNITGTRKLTNDKIYLGKLREDFPEIGGELIYLYKHSWDCNWYWGMGYIGNKDLHTHFDLSFLGRSFESDITSVFSKTKLTQNNWWTILEMFQSAYALKEAAELYHRGGSHISNNLCREKLKNEELAARLNKDLKEVLDTVWMYIEVNIEANLQAEMNK